MPRPPRVHLTGALYYVTSRAMEGVSLFRGTQDYETYLESLRGYQGQFGFKLFAFALLPGEVQLCLELTNSTTISTIMHALNSRYTKYVRKRDGRAGHVFQERFKLTLMEKAPNLLRVTAFIHRLPQHSAGVQDPRTYPWSSFSTYLVPMPAKEVAEVMAQLAAEVPETPYETYVHTITEEQLVRWGAEWQRRIVGSESFIARVEQQMRLQTATASPEASVQRAGKTAPVLLGGEASLPQRSGLSPRASLTLTISISIAFISLCAAALYAKSTSILRTTVHALAQERNLTSLVPPTPSASPSSVTATFATFTPPSALAGTIWSVQVKPMYAAGEANTQTDELRFEAGKVLSSTLSAQGFSASNYSLTPQANGSVLWETMQTGPNDEVICWRGEWDGKTMRGVLTRQQPGRVVSNFAFIGTEQRPAVVGQGAKET